MSNWQRTDPHAVREIIAASHLRAAATDSILGNVTLRAHQRDAAGRLRDCISRFGGALLADEVGLGKTYTALAAVGQRTPLVIVAPAALIDMWRGALERAAMHATVISLESLSRRGPQAVEAALVIVDEAHHARNPLTQRYARLAELTRSSPVLLLSATPVHNAAADLHNLLALFLGSRAERMTPAELSACVVRRTRDDVRDATLPHHVPPVWLDMDGDARVLQALVDIPAPCPARDGAEAGALIVLSLVRAWASTNAALRAALLRRIARASALSDALAVGRHPTRAELLAWVVGEDATQLAFPELMVASLVGEWRALSDAVDQHVSGVRAALAALSASDDADERRCALLREVRQRHPNERIVVFSQFADSVRALFSRLRADGRVAAVTAGGAEVAGGAVTRADVLARFAPHSQGAGTVARVRAGEEIDMLVTTDLLSEGLNLQDASVVVHLDLPWTAARLTQRLGRVWRMGSPHARVHEYAIAPPAPADRLLRATEILKEKAGTAARVVGDAMAPLLTRRAAGGDVAAAQDPNSAREQLRHVLARWLAHADARNEPADDAPAAGGKSIPLASVRAEFDGWLAAVEVDGAVQLVARRGEGCASSDPAVVLEIASAAGGRACIAAPARVARATAEINDFATAQRAARDAGIPAVGARAQRAASNRIAAVAASAPPHRRAAVSRLAASARSAVATSRTVGAERLLSALMADGAGWPSDGAENWLARVVELGEAAAPNAGLTPLEEERPPTVHAVLLLVR
ncbi:MAG TPA: helicase-related protein [Gemmatimonadaceae bacterium]|nr:helicase-related protein [Gemmatimonadaceae bacterium]